MVYIIHLTNSVVYVIHLTKSVVYIIHLTNSVMYIIHLTNYVVYIIHLTNSVMYIIHLTSSVVYVIHLTNSLLYIVHWTNSLVYNAANTKFRHVHLPFITATFSVKFSLILSFFYSNCKAVKNLNTKAPVPDNSRYVLHVRPVVSAYVSQPHQYKMWPRDVTDSRFYVTLERTRQSEQSQVTGFESLADVWLL